MRFKKDSSSCWLAVIAILLAAPMANAGSMQLIQLPTLGEPTNEAVGINNNGVIAGAARDVSGSFDHVVSWTISGITPTLHDYVAPPWSGSGNSFGLND